MANTDSDHGAGYSLSFSSTRLAVSFLSLETRGTNSSSIEIEGGKLRTVYLDKPLVRNKYTPREKNELFYKWTFKRLGLRPGNPYQDCYAKSAQHPALPTSRWPLHHVSGFSAHTAVVESLARSSLVPSETDLSLTRHQRKTT